MKYSIINKLLNPFEDFSDQVLLRFGLLLFIIGGLLAKLGSFDYYSFLKVIPQENHSWLQVYGHLVVNITLLFLFFFLFARLVNKRTRLIDILNVVLVNFGVIYCLGLLFLLFPLMEITQKIQEAMSAGDMSLSSINRMDLLMISVISFISLVFVIYFFYLCIVGVKFVMHGKKGYQGVVVCILILIADVAARYINSTF